MDDENLAVIDYSGQDHHPVHRHYTQVGIGAFQRIPRMGVVALIGLGSASKICMKFWGMPPKLT